MFSKRKNMAILIILSALSQNIFAQNTAPIYRCGNSYSQNPCKGGREIDTTPLIENHDAPQRPQPKRHHHFSQPDYWGQEQTQTRQRQAASKARERERQKRQLCEELAAQIEHLDAQGRIGGTSAYMDRLRERRRLVREEQVQQNCI